MANIKINNLKPAGADLFADDETFLEELSSNEIDMIAGGFGGFGGFGLSEALGNSSASYVCSNNCGGLDMIGFQESLDIKKLPMIDIEPLTVGMWFDF